MELNGFGNISNGHVVLGRKDGEESEVYITRYRIEHPRQRLSLCKETMHGECVPCCSPDHSSPWHQALIAAIRSEVLMFSLHIFTILIGVLKERARLVYGHVSCNNISTTKGILVVLPTAFFARPNS